MSKFSKTNILAWLKKNKVCVALFLIILLGAYLRLSDFSNLARFNADQVRDAKIVNAMISEGEFPLLGPKAGGTTFNLGPAFYYLEYISGLIFGNTPEGIALIVPILAIASIYVFFILMRMYFLANTSLILTFLYATSYYAIRYTRFAWNPNVIPFFLFIFLWSILKLAETRKNERLKWNILLGIIMGIAMQLHTTLLILMPAIFLAVHIYIFFKEKKLPIFNLLSAVLIALALHSPFFLHDIKNNGENIKSFFQGTETKTEKNSSVIQNLLLDGQFFLQGNIYVISGQEPEKNWIKPLKLVASKDGSEIFLFLTGTIFFIFGLCLLIKKTKHEKKNLLLTLALSVLSLLFVLFFPIAKELNLRFFIILIFLPFIFFGLFADFILEKMKNKKLGLLIIIALALIISIINILEYKKTYDLENYRTKESAYGGISLKESRDISNYITSKTQDYDMKNAYIFPFEFERSIDYFNQKTKTSLLKYREGETNKNAIYFYISKSNEKEGLNKLDCCFSIIDSSKTGRFEIFVLKSK